MKVIKNPKNVLILSDEELADLKSAVYLAMQTSDELAKLPDARTEGYGSAKETADRLEVLHNQM